MTIATEGFEETDATLATVENLGPQLVAPMHEATDLLLARVLQTTPVDSGELAGSMDKLVDPRGDTVLGRVFSHGAFGPYGHRYDHYVKSDEHQAWMHRGRVPTMGQDLEAVRPQIEPLFDEAVEEVLNG